MAQDAHKEKATFVAANPNVTALTPSKGLDFYASAMGWSRDKVQEVTRELAIR